MPQSVALRPPHDGSSLGLDRARVSPRGAQRWIAWGLVCVAVGLNLVGLYADLTIQTPFLNDSVLHLVVSERTAGALALGQDATDYWLPTLIQGYPLPHHYQHLPYLAPAGLYLLLRGVVPLAEIFRWSQYLLLSFFLKLIR